MLTLTAQDWATLAQVNRDVNSSIWQEEDEKHYGRAEYWTIPTDGLGDCEDIALTKREKLISAGMPEPALRIAVVTTRRGQSHALLTVATDRGDYVLDSLDDEVLAWSQADYTWIERQDPSRASGWVSLAPNTRVADAGANAPTSALH